MMKVSEIYKKLNLPPNLQLHMYRVASVANVVLDHWKGELPNRDLITHATLLHDVGNLVKVDLDKFPHFLGEEAKRREYWRDVQKDFIERYGKDQHEAHAKILKELNIPERVREIIGSTSINRVNETLTSTDFERKICQYADTRVGPFGVMSVEARWQEGQKRYRHLYPSDAPETERLHQGLLSLEKQLQEHVSIRPEEISDASIASYLETLPMFEIKTA